MEASTGVLCLEKMIEKYINENGLRGSQFPGAIYVRESPVSHSSTELSIARSQSTDFDLQTTVRAENSVKVTGSPILPFLP